MYKLTITDEQGRVVAYATIEHDIQMERQRERRGERPLYDPYRDDGIIRPNYYRYQNGFDNPNDITMHMRVIPQKDGSLIKMFKHKPVDKLPGGV